ncbi:hypothetical protein BH09CHL1_BH09CHL1_06320 [soil metagenome]
MTISETGNRNRPGRLMISKGKKSSSAATWTIGNSESTQRHFGVVGVEIWSG